MALVRFEVVRREGEDLLPCRALDGSGRAWRLLASGSHADARWLGTSGGRAIWGVREADHDGETGSGEVLEIDERLHDDATDLGPEATSEGLFDRTGTEAVVSGDITGSVATGTSAARRTAALAWVAATADPERSFPLPESVAVPRLLRIIEEEPVDLLPPLDPGMPPPPPPPPRPAAAPPEVVERPPDADAARGPQASVAWLLAALLLVLAAWIASH